ncbi:MAG: S-layer homology domain-containing protein [Thermicanus sp.]|nr:S-layer homology domain-containing protein [Thermicanus sp.]
MAVMAVRAWGKLGSYPTEAFNELSFVDAGKLSPWAKEAVENAVKNGLMVGKSRQIFDPKGFATRAEAAAVIFRIMEKGIHH